MGNFAGKTEKKVQGMPITIVKMREVGKLFDPNFSFILVATEDDNLSLPTWWTVSWTKAGR